MYVWNEGPVGCRLRASRPLLTPASGARVPQLMDTRQRGQVVADGEGEGEGEDDSDEDAFEGAEETKGAAADADAVILATGYGDAPARPQAALGPPLDNPLHRALAVPALSDHALETSDAR